MLIQTHGPIEIHLDQDAESPREWCNLGTFWTMHRSYASPDPHTHEDQVPKDAIVLPVWMYSHGAVAYAAAERNPFHCPWDSGQVGVIFVTRSDIRKEFGWKRISKKREQKIKDLLKGEVEVFSQWANGEVYGFVNTETGDSCWGFYSIEEALNEAA